MRIPDFQVDAKSFGPSLHWRDADRRYHIWLNEDGSPKGETLHSNPIISADPRANEHRALKLTAKKWAPLVAAMVAKIKSDDLITKARERAEAEERATNAKRLNEIRLADLSRLDRALVRLPVALAKAIRELPETDRLSFVSALDVQP